jgi:uncharacterized protein YjiS (DUF1127 family)
MQLPIRSENRAMTFQTDQGKSTSGPFAEFALAMATARATAFDRLVDCYRMLLLKRRRRATIRALEELSDDVLKDIGLHRSEIRSAALHPLDRVRR